MSLASHQTDGAALEIAAVYGWYWALVSDSRSGFDSDCGLGGRLLYLGEMTVEGARLARAANIAGATMLAAAADGEALRKAMREGALDFVVSSLDEALRILKNEVRKKQPVAVGVTVGSADVEAEMAKRGVQPDLLAPGQVSGAAVEEFVKHGARPVEPALQQQSSLAIFPIPADWKQSAAAFDELLLDCLDPNDDANRRWVRLSPRYLPAAARRLRSINAGEDALAGLKSKLPVDA